MYKVFAVEGGHEIFWCPSAPVHYTDKIPYDGKVYSTRAAAYRRVKQLNDALREKQAGERKDQSSNETDTKKAA